MEAIEHQTEAQKMNGIDFPWHNGTHFSFQTGGHGLSLPLEILIRQLIARQIIKLHIPLNCFIENEAKFVFMEICFEQCQPNIHRLVF